MRNSIIQILKNKFLKFDLSDRTKRANINIFISFLFKSGSILLSFILIPMTINYIKPDVYGVWLTLSSLVGWISMFDIGIANGLRNKLSESLAAKNLEQSKTYVSTTYVIISLIAFFLMIIYFLFYRFVNWQEVFNSKFIEERELQNVVTIVSVLFLLKFISDIINVIAAAYQMVSLNSILLFISNLGTVLAVWLLSKSTKADIVLLSLCLSFIPFFISVLVTFYLFTTSFKEVKPSFKKIDFKESKSIVSLGSQFFILQIIVLVVFQTDNILIAQFFNPSEVTNFNIAYKYYSIVIIVFSILLTPYWTAFTEAYFKKDFNWIQGTIKRLITYWLLSLLVLIIMFFMCEWVIRIWIGDTIKIPTSLSLSICAYIAITNWNSIFANFLNGVGKIKVQIVYAVVMGLVNIPLCFLFVKGFHLGTFAMPLSNFICLIFGGLISYIQYRKIINENAKGIWNK